MLLVTAGEAGGFAIPGVAWFAGWQLDFAPIALAALVVAGGAGEGFVLGTSQRHALAHATDPGRSWVAATAAAAAFAWVLGMAPNTAYDLGAPAWTAVALGVAGAPFILISIGVAQAMVLRRFVRRARRWVWVNIGAWLAALPVSFIGPALVPNGSAAWVFGVAWVVSGVVMAAILAAVTGWGMRKLLAGATAPG